MPRNARIEAATHLALGFREKGWTYGECQVLYIGIVSFLPEDCTTTLMMAAYPIWDPLHMHVLPSKYYRREACDVAVRSTDPNSADA